MQRFIWNFGFIRRWTLIFRWRFSWTFSWTFFLQMKVQLKVHQRVQKGWDPSWFDPVSSTRTIRGTSPTEEPPPRNPKPRLLHQPWQASETAEYKKLRPGQETKVTTSHIRDYFAKVTSSICICFNSWPLFVLAGDSVFVCDNSGPQELCKWVSLIFAHAWSIKPLHHSTL